MKIKALFTKLSADMKKRLFKNRADTEKEQAKCSSCAFLSVLNIKGLYAYCVIDGTRFEPYQLDTTHDCTYYKPEQKGAGENDGD